MIADTKWKLQELSQNAAKESEKKSLNINFKKTEPVVVSKKNDPRRER